MNLQIKQNMWYLKRNDILKISTIIYIQLNSIKIEFDQTKNNIILYVVWALINWANFGHVFHSPKQRLGWTFSSRGLSGFFTCSGPKLAQRRRNKKNYEDKWETRKRICNEGNKYLKWWQICLILDLLDSSDAN